MSEFSFFIEQLSEHIKQLPGEKAHLDLMPLNRPFTSDALKRKPNFRHSAVALIFYPENSEIKSVLIQRPNYDGTHGGQISFPGGKMDPTDPHLEFTARREAFEEVNLPMEAGIFIGKLSEIYIPVSNFLVEPNLFYVNKLSELIPDKREVEAIIHFNVLDLLQPEILKSEDMKFEGGFTRKNIPYYDIQGHKVWGATGMILAEFKTIISRFL
jgi:8-oxo-dGTP pyrophosphatase MutT (NUDIX family)